MKIQRWGIVYVIFLILSIVLIDRIIILDLPFSLEYQKWPCIIYVAILTVVICGISCCVVRNEEKKEQIDRHPWNEKIMLMFTNTAKGNFLDILILFTFLAFAAWIPDTFFDWIKDGKCWFRPIMYIIGLVLFVWGKPGVVSADKIINVDKRKLLLTGMSNFNQTNIYPLIEPLNKYPNIETFVILLSDTIWKGYDKIEIKEEKTELNDVLKIYKEKISSLNLGNEMKLLENDEITRKVESALRNLLLAYIKKVDNYKNKEINIVFSKPVDYNNFDACNNVCYQVLKYVMGERKFSKYQDYEVVVNTTPGTAIVTSAMTLNAIKGNRAMIYTTQGQNPEVKAANPNATLIQFDSLIEERELN